MEKQCVIVIVQTGGVTETRFIGDKELVSEFVKREAIDILNR